MLELRIERQNKSAMKIVQFLESNPKIGQVFYPGLKSDPGHDIAKNQMLGFGGMMAFKLKEDNFVRYTDFYLNSSLHMQLLIWELLKPLSGHHRPQAMLNAPEKSEQLWVSLKA